MKRFAFLALIFVLGAAIGFVLYFSVPRNQRAPDNETNIVNNMKRVYSALVTYEINVGSFPTSLNLLTFGPENEDLALFIASDGLRLNPGLKGTAHATLHWVLEYRMANGNEFLCFYGDGTSAISQETKP